MLSIESERLAVVLSRPERLDQREQIEIAIPEAARVMRNAYEAHFARLGISLKQALIIGRLDVADKHTMNQTEIASKTGLRKAAAGIAIDTLVALGLVYRTTDPDDGRAKLVALTEQGSALAVRVDQAFGEMAATIRKGTTREQRRAVVTALATMRRNLSEMVDDELRELPD